MIALVASGVGLVVLLVAVGIALIAAGVTLEVRQRRGLVSPPPDVCNDDTQRDTLRG